MSNETEELNMPGFGFVWDFADRQMRLTKNGVELSLTFEQAGSLVEQIWRLLDDAGAGPAAGPWIRVDSGERPEDGEDVLLRTYIPKNVQNGIEWGIENTLVGYLGADDEWRVNESRMGIVDDVTHWARIYLPRKR